MRICFTLDDVIRAKTRQFCKMYKKYINPDFEIDEENVNTDDLCELFKFKSEKEFQKFLYTDYPFEIFAEAETMEKMLDKKFNLWCLSLREDDDIEEKPEIIIGNPMEFNASIGYTHFFLSKIATRVRETSFPSDSQDLWKNCDVMVTASPKLINNKPEGKIVIKIETPYNKEIKSDYTYKSLSEFLEDKETQNKILGKDE